MYTEVHFDKPNGYQLSGICSYRPSSKRYVKALNKVLKYFVERKSVSIKLSDNSREFNRHIAMFCESNDLDYKKPLKISLNTYTTDRISFIVEQSDDDNYILFDFRTLVANIVCYYNYKKYPDNFDYDLKKELIEKNIIYQI